ncbi:MAG: RluA family pseudouridine synthase [Tannerellaceae bacterium]|jgi:23S rRNA pseudouridine1911/1915/1917 synthase|nr:RluA family pseudouridine synthase [Tannerellaceae bacterium]
MNVIYEDNHVIAINKTCGEIVQGDKSGDTPLSEQLKEWLKEKYQKPGNVFVGVTHRIDRPVSGVILFAKTTKALSRLNEMFRLGQVKKTYWAIIKNHPPKEEDELTHWLCRNEVQNKCYAYDEERPHSKQAVLRYKLIDRSDRYFLLEIHLKTGRHHQIRTQLAKIGCPIKGDLKYGAERSNPDGGICLHALSLEFVHPVSKEAIKIVAPVPPSYYLCCKKMNTEQINESSNIQIE